MLLLCTLSPLSSTSSLSSRSSSPPFLSPDSVSSDSSTSSTSFSESSMDSPLAASCSLPVVSTWSDFSNLSLKSKTSCQDISIPKPLAVNSTLPPSTRSSLSPVKRVSPSLAERRGSLSKSLKLPVMTSNVRENSNPAILTGQVDDVKINNNSYTFCKPDSIEIVFEGKKAIRKRSEELTHMFQLKIPPGRIASSNSCLKEFTPVNNFSESCRNFSVGEGLNSKIPNGLKKA